MRRQGHYYKGIRDQRSWNVGEDELARANGRRGGRERLAERQQAEGGSFARRGSGAG